MPSAYLERACPKDGSLPGSCCGPRAGTQEMPNKRPFQECSGHVFGLPATGSSMASRKKAGSTSSHPQPSLWTDFLRPPQERPNSLSSVPSLANSPLPQIKILAAGPVQKTNKQEGDLSGAGEGGQASLTSWPPDSQCGSSGTCREVSFLCAHIHAPLVW